MMGSNDWCMSSDNGRSMDYRGCGDSMTGNKSTCFHGVGFAEQWRSWCNQWGSSMDNWGCVNDGCGVNDWCGMDNGSSSDQGWGVVSDFRRVRVSGQGRRLDGDGSRDMVCVDLSRMVDRCHGLGMGQDGGCEEGSSGQVSVVVGRRCQG